MDFPQTHHTNDGRAVQVDRAENGGLTFADGERQLATLTPAGGGIWELRLRDGERRELHAAQDDPPIAAAMVQIDLREDEDDDTSGTAD